MSKAKKTETYTLVNGLGDSSVREVGGYMLATVHVDLSGTNAAGVDWASARDYLCIVATKGKKAWDGDAKDIARMAHTNAVLRVGVEKCRVLRAVMACEPMFSSPCGSTVMVGEYTDRPADAQYTGLSAEGDDALGAFVGYMEAKRGKRGKARTD